MKMEDISLSVEDISSIPLWQLTDKFPHMDFRWEQEIHEILSPLKNWYFVGGCVRDSLLGKKTLDIDVTTLSRPEEVAKLLGNYSLSLIGKRFGTIGVFVNKWKIEITTTRLDKITYGRKADVEFGHSFVEDSKRRDFTVNSLLKGAEGVIDLHGGLEDLRNKKIKFIGHPEARITEDYLRILRYFRFSLRFGSTIDIYDAVIRENMRGLSQLSMERVVSEFMLMCQYERINETIRHINSLGISTLIFGVDLPDDMDLSLSIERKIAHLFLPVLGDLPIPRNIKQIIAFHRVKHDDLHFEAARIWRKYQSRETLDLFLEIHNIERPLNYDIPKIDLEVFPAPNRMFVEIVVRYLVLKNLPISQDNMDFYSKKLEGYR